MSAEERERMIEIMTREMKEAARKLEFEQAAFLRDQIRKLREGKIDAPQKTHTRRKK
jgi:excinuclease ABC subunit B